MGSSWIARYVGAMAAAITVAAAGPSRADTSLDLTHAVELGARRGPGVAVASAPRAELSSAAAAARPPLSLPARAQVYGGTRFFPSGAPGLEVQAQVVQDVPLRSLGAARHEVVSAELGAVRADVKRARATGALRAALAWVDAREATDLLALRAADRAEAEAIARFASARVASGKAPPHEVASARAELALADVELLHAEGVLAEALYELRFATGLRPNEPVALVGDLRTPDETAAPEGALRARAGEHPEIAAADARARAAGTEAKLVVASSSAPLGLGVVYGREGSGEHLVAGVVVVPLPWSSQGAYEAHRAQARAAAQTEHARLVRAERELALEVSLHEREHTRAERAALDVALAPLAEAARLAKVEYDTGTVDAAPLLLARRRLIEGRERLVRASAAVRRADLRLAHAGGTLAGAEP